MTEVATEHTQYPEFNMANFEELPLIEESDRFQADNKLYVHFRRGVKINHTKSIEAGRPIYDECDFITIMTPGNKGDIIERQVDGLDEYRFAAKYNLWKVNQENIQSGTPLSEWPRVSVAQLEELKALKIFTVEQLIAAPDTGMFMGIQDLKRKAITYLDTSSKDAANAKLEAQLAERDAQIKALSDKIDSIAVGKQPKG